MQTIQAIEQEIQQLPEAELCELRRWFTEDLWDKQIENDANAGKLDALAAEFVARRLG